MDMQLFFQEHQAISLSAIVLLGLAIGSFLNVVIYRLPIMMKQQWRDQCLQLLDCSTGSGEDSADTEMQSHDEEEITIVTPRSRCPHCGHQINAIENIPLLSYIMLRGRCRHCHAGISIRYPLVETATAFLSVIVVWHFGLGWTTMAALMFTWSLIALSVIDLDCQLLPDSITLPLLWLGLAVNLFGIFTDINSSVVGAIAGYTSLWLVYLLFKWATGKEGMGYGDFKLLAAIGAWSGWQALPMVILLSAFLGAAIGIGLIILKGRDRNVPIPFGPFLSAAGWLSILWGEQIKGVYWAITGLHF
jgi:leader peptidase (prepilin peptidase)/N-methyltransferase